LTEKELEIIKVDQALFNSQHIRPEVARVVNIQVLPNRALTNLVANGSTVTMPSGARYLLRSDGSLSRLNKNKSKKSKKAK
jgi:hypothetical protein